MTADLWTAVESMTQELIEADNLAFARLMLTRFPEKHEGVIASLVNVPAVQYR